MQQLMSDVYERARTLLGAQDGAAFAARLVAAMPELQRTVGQLYPDPAVLPQLIEDALELAAARPEPLRRLDRERSADPAWFQASSMIGYVCYADRFAGDLAGVRDRLDHLAALNVRYLHLMPVLRPRPGDNDGGYAVADYEAVDPRLGSMADLSALAEDLHGREMALCIDLVLNHTAAEHEWARRAADGDQFYRDFYLIYPDRSLPDAYERTLPDIFPELAPGSFTFDARLNGWVWTTFYPYQWDLNYANPAVFRAMLQTMLRLANRGVDVLRLDAAPFLWKRLGTDCQDQPEAHLVLQAMRALSRLAAPGLLLKAEAMVAPEILAGYLGAHETYHPECDIAYDNQLMVMLWDAAAAGDARLAAQALSRRAPAPPATTWVTYIRCHDDIGWAVSDVDAAAVGLDGAQRRRWLSEFYSGQTPDSFARGEVFQLNPTGASPISGTLAALCGITAARDAAGLELALRRLESLYSVVYSFGGIPLLFSGDELALGNDETSSLALRDNRWLHRPRMNWSGTVADSASVPGRALRALRSLGRARAALPALAGTEPTTVLGGNGPVLRYLRGRPGHEPVLAAVNFSTDPALVELPAGAEPVHLHSTAGVLDFAGDRIRLPGCGFAWLGLS
ncbi:MAG TPA: alpha-amylase family glycosyl hydrolase [Jatrophihabitans sp.]|nr:alpha-amylase family glycosyl hydrolase [Jatrophihabitans sp.]